LSCIKPGKTAGSETIKMILLFHLRPLARHSLSHQTGSVGLVNQILTHNKLVAVGAFTFRLSFLAPLIYLFILPSTPLGHGVWGMWRGAWGINEKNIFAHYAPIWSAIFRFI